MSEHIKIVEVGARDGLQNEAKTLSVDDRAELIKRLYACGLKHIEGGSFVSPTAIPQMQASEDVWKKVSDLDADISFLVANEKGLERAFDAGVKSISVFSATSDTFNKKNTNKSVEESLALFDATVKQAIDKKLRVRGYVSTAFGCPYEGAQSTEKVVAVSKALFDMGCYEVSIGDTIGVAQPTQVKEVFESLAKNVELSHCAAHMHDTRGFALVNIYSAYEVGVRIFDSSVGGLGGCPYATGSSGNVATEEVARLIEGLGLRTALSIENLLKVARWVEKKLENNLKAKFYLSQPKEISYH